MTIFLIVAGIALCIAGSFFFSSSEMAYSSCNTNRLESDKEKGSKRAARALHIIEKFDDALSAILIGNNLVNIASSSLGSVLVILLLGSDQYAWISTVVLTILVIIFGETMPKIIAKKNANKMALSHSFWIRLLMIVLKPVIWVVVGLISLLTFWIKPEENNSADEAVEELQMIIETAEDEAVLDEDQTELVQAAIDFSDISAQDAMTARVDIIAIDIDDEWENIMETIETSPYSRLPVYEDSIDNIIGILYLNHFLKAQTEQTKVDIRKLLMPACYVYKTMKLPNVLNQFRRAKQHLVIVSDEFGGTYGVLSMEDVLEQIVGDIWDETDTVELEVVELENGCYELDGAMVLSDFLELLEISEADFEAESETVGGWTIESFDGFYPKEGDSFRYQNLTLTVLSMDERRVEKVLIKPCPKDTQE